mgnify:FL=1|jgi:hypothetical protein
MSKLIDFETKKSVHINLTKSTHAGLRIELFERGLSMQEVFNSLASGICEGNTYLHKLLDEIQTSKREKVIKQVTNSDAESIFNVIEGQSPLTKR